MHTCKRNTFYKYILKWNSFSFSFLPGKSLHWSYSQLDFPYWYTKTNKRALWTTRRSRGSCSCLRSEGDLQSLSPGEDAAEQCHPCLHSFKSVPGIFPSPCAARPPHRLTKGHIHQWAATSYNPFERQQAVPALPRLVLKSSSFLARASPGLSQLTPVLPDGFEGPRTNCGGLHGVGKDSLGQQVLLKWLHSLQEPDDFHPGSCLVSCPRSSHGQAAAEPRCSGWGEPSLHFQPQFIHGQFAPVCSHASAGQ